MARLRIAFYLFFFCICVSSSLCRIGASEVSWTMVVVPDTQNFRANNGHLPKLHAMMQWIVDSKDSRNILFVAGQGDITGSNHPIDWGNQAVAWGILNGEVPYSATTGNHDYDPTGEKDATLINDFFSLSDNPLNSITTERIAGEIENSYSTFETPDGRDMLVFSLEWDPRAEVLGWANAIASQSQFADHTAVLLTHAYLREWKINPDGSDNIFRSPEIGEPIWEGLVNQNENFELVLNGHYLDYDDSDPYGKLSAGYQASVGLHGNTVHEILFNAQEQPNGGNGYMRLMEFMDDGQTVQVRTYSPTLDVWLTSDRHEFSIQLTPLFSANFDGDADVDGADFLAWQRGSGITAGAQFDQGDANQNGAVDETDLGVWLQQFGTTDLLPAAKSIPEPQSAALLILALLQYICRRKGI